MKKKIIIYLILLISLTFFLLGCTPEKLEPQDLSNKTEDRIHFINVGIGDCILLESNGKFALIDAGEDAKSWRFLMDERKGYEKEVLSYIKNVARNEEGIVELEFALGTHSHSDHLGNMDSIILDKNISVKKLILKEYQSENIRFKEIFWSNAQQYKNVVKAMKNELGKKWNENISFNPTNEKIEFGDFTITLYNTEKYTGNEVIGENENSIVEVLEIRGKKICLAADINNLPYKYGLGQEDILGPKIGKVDVLKLGHHGYYNSNTSTFLDYLHPEIAIVTNEIKNVHPNTLKKLDEINTNLYSSNVGKGIILEVLENEIIINEVTENAE